MKKLTALLAFMAALFCQPIFAQQAILDEYVPGVRLGMTANELAESRPNIFNIKDSRSGQGQTGAKTEQLDGDPVVSATYRFGWPDSLGLMEVEFICLDRDVAIETAQRFAGGALENRNTHFFKMADGTSATLMLSDEKITVRWFPGRGRRLK